MVYWQVGRTEGMLASAPGRIRVWSADSSIYRMVAVQPDLRMVAVQPIL